MADEVAVGVAIVDEAEISGAGPMAKLTGIQDSSTTPFRCTISLDLFPSSTRKNPAAPPAKAVLFQFKRRLPE